MINCELGIGQEVLCRYDGGYFHGIIAGARHQKQQFRGIDSKITQEEQNKIDKNVEYLVTIDKIGHIERPQEWISRPFIFLSGAEALVDIEKTSESIFEPRDYELGVSYLGNMYFFNGIYWAETKTGERIEPDHKIVHRIRKGKTLFAPEVEDNN